MQRNTKRVDKKYNEDGINGLESKKKPGNPLAKYSAKKI